MELVSQPMGTTDARVVAGWVYDPPYDFYNVGGTDEAIAELVDGSYRLVQSTDGDVIGFYCVGQSAQVPSGVGAGVYAMGRDVVDVGIGMRPELTGRGLGTTFFAFVVREILRHHPRAQLRLTVATFNKRAIRLYEKFDFRAVAEFEHQGMRFQVMTRSSDVFAHNANES